MDPLAIHHYLETLITPTTPGAILIDSTSGLCLGAIGTAKEEDAPTLTIAARTACDQEGVGAVVVRGERVLLRLGKEVDGNRVLVGVWKKE